MANKVSTRARIAWRAFSVQALALIATLPNWYPHVEALATLYMGPDAEKYLTTLLAIAGIMGWAIPQQKVQRHVESPR